MHILVFFSVCSWEKNQPSIVLQKHPVWTWMEQRKCSRQHVGLWLSVSLMQYITHACGVKKKPSFNQCRFSVIIQSSSLQLSSLWSVELRTSVHPRVSFSMVNLSRDSISEYAVCQMKEPAQPGDLFLYWGFAPEISGCCHAKLKNTWLIPYGAARK